ncbi:6-phosphogluconolactonase [Deminuibacter soli]|uniref:6-phosphogluconolactonase n=1 Tax=Deminuibacter soli TaxID=2291815 RepID=A0A3E1NRL8_9BACT|nr:6-phosphogluconolactonase [Deminuibacter soli]RFM30418.1 6-phosphogluconolactonase [Deminuibacter soli]
MQIHISKNIDELSTTYADWLVGYIQDVLQKQQRFTIALSGGSTPKKLHELLATDAYKNKIDWTKLHVFWGDERFVPLTDERSNAKMAFDTLLNHVPVPKEQIHIMQTENITAEESAAAYEKLLHEYFDGEPFTFDLVILGMGDDGHTLSLFPFQPVVHETKHWVTSFWLQAQDMYRVTLTHPVANRSACVTFLATGEKKATVLHEVIKGEKNVDRYPSQIINPDGQLHWFVDEAAAAALK